MAQSESHYLTPRPLTLLKMMAKGGNLHGGQMLRRAAKIMESLFNSTAVTILRTAASWKKKYDYQF